MDLSVNLKRGREQAPPLAPLTGTNGDHAELLARRGMYYSLYNSQFTEAVGAPSRSPRPGTDAPLTPSAGHSRTRRRNRCEATGVAIGFGSVLSTARTCSKGTLTDTSKRLQLDVEDQVLLVVFRGWSTGRVSQRPTHRRVPGITGRDCSRRVAVAASGDAAAVDQVADLVGCVRGRTIEDRVQLDLLCRSGVTGQFTHQRHTSGARGAATAEIVAGGSQNGRQRDSVGHCGSFLGDEFHMIESLRHQPMRPMTESHANHAVPSCMWIPMPFAGSNRSPTV